MLQGPVRPVTSCFTRISMMRPDQACSLKVLMDLLEAPAGIPDIDPRSDQ